MARKYTDNNFVVQTLNRITSQRNTSVDQIPFSLAPFTIKSAIAPRQSMNPSGAKAYIVAQRPNPREFLFEPDNSPLNHRELASSDYEIQASDDVIAFTAVNRSIKLPNANKFIPGFAVTIKDISGNAKEDESLSIFIERMNANNKIDGLADNIEINSAYGSVTLLSDGGSNWYII